MSGTAVYITGAGIISAIGNSLAQTSRSLSDGISGIGKPEILKTSHTGLPCGEVKLSNEQLCKDLDIREGEGYNRTALLGIHAVRQAIRQAALTERQTGKALLFSGTTVGGMDSTEKHFLEMADEGKYLNLLSTHDSGSTTELISGYFGILPENTVTISTACSSAANAIIAGAEMIKARKADIVIAGGSEALSRFHLNGFNSLMILDNEPCRPFDKTRKGLNLGEGAAFIVMESEESLIKRNARPLAILAGYGNRCDAFHQTASSENGDGAVLAMEEAIEMAGIKPADIDYINAHGTGTPNNDESESRALQRVFGEKIPPVSSTKSFTGHTTSAAGAIETVISLIALTEGIIPANLGWKVQMEGGITPTSGVKGALLHNVMCNSFGFGGNDSSLILSKGECGKRDFPQEEVKTKCVSAARLDPGDELSLSGLRERISPMESRRLCKLLKGALLTSLSALREAGIESPDAIIAGTSYGMLENSEKFLLQMCREGEKELSPTLFMQSTHNTMAGMIAIKTKCHGYNITYTHLSAERVLGLCRANAEMLIRQGKAKSVLIGYHNEVTPLLHDMILKLNGKELPVGVTSISMVIEKEN